MSSIDDFRRLIITSIMLAGVVPAQSATVKGDNSVPSPPAAKRLPKVEILHGDRRQDDYFWLREKSNPEVAAYLEAENRYTDAVMKPTQVFQEALYREMLGRIKQTDVTVPYPLRGYYYYYRTEEGKQYPILCRKKGSLDAKEEITLDV